MQIVLAPLTSMVQQSTLIDDPDHVLERDSIWLAETSAWEDACHIQGKITSS